MIDVSGVNLLDVRQYVVAWGAFAALLVILASARATSSLGVALAFLVLFATATLATGLRPFGRAT